MGIKIPSETQGGGGTCFVILGLSLPICKMARLSKMLSKGAVHIQRVRKADPSLDGTGGPWTMTSSKVL